MRIDACRKIPSRVCSPGAGWPTLPAIGKKIGNRCLASRFRVHSSPGEVVGVAATASAAIFYL